MDPSPYHSALLVFSGVFAVVGVLWLLGIASFVLGIAALISVAQTPSESFGPWWDNTKQIWLIGIAVSFLIPFGHLVSAISWFRGGRRPLREGQGVAGRPFWAGPPKLYPPAPMPPPPGWGGYPPRPGR